MKIAWLVCVVGLVTAAPGATVAQTTSTANPALPQGDDLTLADGAGNVVIGLSVRPAQPGPNTVLIDVVPMEGAAAAADVDVSLAINGQPVLLDFCSRSCRTADVTLAGGEHVDVVANSPSGGTVSFDLPSLPAPDGSSLLQQVQDRMHQLHTLRSDETLGPVVPPIETQYAFEAPDRMQLDISNGAHTIFIGATRYTLKDGSAAGWQPEDAGMPLQTPLYVWDPRPPSGGFVASHLVGTDQVDGVDTQVVAFFENLGPLEPFWFRLWVDSDGLVHRAEMRGQGHFMDEHYTDFDAPFTIDPPV